MGGGGCATYEFYPLTLSSLCFFFFILIKKKRDRVRERVRNRNAAPKFKSLRHEKKQKQNIFFLICLDRKSTRLNSSHSGESRMPSSA